MITFFYKQNAPIAIEFEDLHMYSWEICFQNSVVVVFTTPGWGSAWIKVHAVAGSACQLSFKVDVMILLQMGHPAV